MGAIAALLLAGSAAAHGPCGQDFDGNHACPVDSPANEQGALVTDNETDYYVFYANKGTDLSASITDTEDPRCTDEGGCGDASVELYDAQGDDLSEGAYSQPNNGITVPGEFGHTVEASGTYYLVVSGDLGVDANSNPTAVPYVLGVNASPGVHWPPVTSTRILCRTKHVRRHHRRFKVRVCHRVTVLS